MSERPKAPAASGILANEDRTIVAQVILVKDQIFRFASVYWIPALAGTMTGNAPHVRHAGESRNPAGLPVFGLFD